MGCIIINNYYYWDVMPIIIVMMKLCYYWFLLIVIDTNKGWKRMHVIMPCRISYTLYSRGEISIVMESANCMLFVVRVNHL